MVIRNTQRLKNFIDVHLAVKGNQLGQVTTFKYLGVIINETLTWHDYIDSDYSKVGQRLGLLKRIKHLLFLHIRKILVNTMIFPILQYANIVWGDKNSVVLMNLIQTLQSRAAKLILDRPIYSSATDALKTLNWLDLKTRRSAQRCIFMFKLLDNQVETDSDAYCIIRGGASNIHHCNTRKKDYFRTVRYKSNKSSLRSYNCFLSEWNSLSEGIRNLPTLQHFKRSIYNYFKLRNSIVVFTILYFNIVVILNCKF